MRVVLAVLVSVLALCPIARAQEPLQFGLIEAGVGYVPHGARHPMGINANLAYVAPVRYPLSFSAGVHSLHFGENSRANFRGVAVGPRISIVQQRDSPAGMFVEIVATLYHGGWSGGSHLVSGYQGSIGVIGPSLGGLLLEMGATYAVTSGYRTFSSWEDGLEQGGVFVRLARAVHSGTR